MFKIWDKVPPMSMLYIGVHKLAKNGAHLDGKHDWEQARKGKQTSLHIDISTLVYIIFLYP